MKHTSYLKNSGYLAACFTAVPLLLFVMVSWFSGNDKKFEETPLRVPLSEVKKEWGTPDREYHFQDGNRELALFYDTNVAGSSKYVFVFKNGKLIRKAIDD